MSGGSELSDADPCAGLTWVPLARLADLPPDSGREVVHAGRVVALFRVEDQVTALQGLCPHQQAHLAAGTIDPARNTVTCPRLGCLRWRFNLQTGAHAAGLPVACATWPVRVAGGVVLVAFPE